jgi:hypothetical protein
MLRRSAAIVASVMLFPGCGASKDTAEGTRATARRRLEMQHASARATVRSAGLAVTLTATPVLAKTGTPVEFKLTAYAPHAPGAFGYQLRYGDGTSAGHSTVPLVCIEGESVPMRQTWRLTHRYKAAGRYRVSVSVYVDCTRDHATTTVRVSIA